MDLPDVCTRMTPEMGEYFFTTKTEVDNDSTMDIRDETEDLNEGLETPAMSEEQVYFEETLNACSEIEIQSHIKQEWNEDEATTSQVEDSQNSDSGDEETIATFVTSTGQQLALYAVEDSDSVYAVAVYDESGLPPTNFDFLMKSEVERLIGEGAVRTVKKPSQIKTQTYQGHVSINENPHSSSEKVKYKINVAKPKYKSSTRSQKITKPVLKTDNVEATATVSTNDFDDDLSYENIGEGSFLLVKHDSTLNSEEVFPKSVKEKPVELDKSTVQYILLGEDQSDSELTFDEIQKTLEIFEKKKSLQKSPVQSPISSPVKSPTENGNYFSPPTSPIRSPVHQKTPEPKVTRKVLQNTVLKQKHTPSALLTRKPVSSTASKPLYSTAIISYPGTEVTGSTELSSNRSPESISKIKRPRKQQLITVNRADSEIIIQPASMVSDEEPEPVRKRGRRKKRKDNNNFKEKRRYNLPRKIRRNPIVEVIDIEVDDDELENVQLKTIEEITIDDSKEKGSSDKENEIIMVGDSDDEEEEEDEHDEEEDDGEADESNSDRQKNIHDSRIIQCEHCNRSFRQKRALETHSRICPKSPESRKRLNTRTTRGTSSRSIDETKKSYKCKICSETFDVVVALARHVRSHYKKKETAERILNESKKKRGENKTKNLLKKAIDKNDKDKTEERKLILTHKNVKTRLLRSWKSKNINCTHCGRWFASAAMLADHCLQHDTKNTGKQMRRCQICRKLFRSRHIFIRHMRIHGSAKKQLQKTRLQRITRQSTSKITSIRKRGRQRKL